MEYSTVNKTFSRKSKPMHLTATILLGLPLFSKLTDQTTFLGQKQQELYSVSKEKKTQV